MDGPPQDNQSLPGENVISSNEEGDTGASTSSASNEVPIIKPTNRQTPDAAIEGIAASPPQFVTLNEIMSTSNGLKNMHLMHEIALNKDFKLTPFEPPERSLHKFVKETLHRAFWDLLSEELNTDPPKYDRALTLLTEVKETLSELLFWQNAKLKEELNEMIDIPFIKQQAENGALDFFGYAQFIINFMGQICAPARDDNIRELKEKTDPVEIFKGVFETLTLMRLDLANFEIEMLRSKMIAESVNYEKKKFADALALLGGLDTLVHTKKWLRRHLEEMPDASEKDVVLAAYLELFEWNLPEECPETVVMDFARHVELGQRLFQLIISGCILLVTLSRATWPILQQNASFKEKLLHDMGILVHDVKDDETLKSALPNIAVQVINVLKQYLNPEADTENTLPTIEIDSAFEQSLTGLLVEIHHPDHNVRKIVKQRTKEFLRVAISSTPNIPKQVPPGLSSLRSDLLSTTGSIVRLYQYNIAVFGEYYSQIIASLKQENENVL